jgi:hypothetical protein
MAAHPIYWVEGVRSTLHAGIGTYRRHFRVVPRSDILPLSGALQDVPTHHRNALTILFRNAGYASTYIITL